MAKGRRQRCRSCARSAAGRPPPETVGNINGDVEVNRRDPIISGARVVIMTPDVCHAWMTRRADSLAVRDFLSKLRNVIIDEAHVYEDVFGSNAGCFFRPPWLCVSACPNWLTGIWTWAGCRAEPTVATR